MAAELHHTGFQTAVTVTPGAVDVSGIRLDRRPAGLRGVPSWDEYGQLALDGPTFATVQFAARAIARGDNLLLEGATATSKTSALLWLAALLRQPVVRVNLSTHAEPADLIGRYAPNPHGGLCVAELTAHREQLTPTSLAILAAAEAGGRELDRVEQARILAAEGWSLVDRPWLWQDGPLLRALTEGAWLLLDEVNLGGAVLERLNSILETPRTFYLSEGDGRRYGPGGLAIHPAFRVIATMNPAEYAGRSALSPAFRNRFSARFTPEPGEQDFLIMLRCLALGETPQLTLGGQVLAGAAAGAPALRPLWPNVREVVGIERVLERLAALHHKLAAMARATEDDAAGTLGSERREGYAYTRRDLRRVLDLVEDGLAAGSGAVDTLLREAIDYVYCQRLADPAESRAVRDLIEAMGISGTQVSADALPAGRRVVGPILRPSHFWQTYEGLLGTGEVVAFPLVYDGGLLEVTTGPPHGEARFDAVLALLSGGAPVAHDDSGGEGGSSRLLFAGQAEDLFLGTHSQGGSYKLSYRLMEDNQAQLVIEPLQVWQTIVATVEEQGEVKAWFEARAGQSYEFSTCRNHHGDCVAGFDSKLAITEVVSGRQVAFDDDGGVGMSSWLIWRPAKDGWYELTVAGYGGSAGSFRLAYRLTDAGPTVPPDSGDDEADPFAEDEHETAEIIELLPTASWRRVEGVLRSGDEQQWFEFDGQAGDELIFSTSPATGRGGANFDTALTLYDPAGDEIAEDDDGGVGLTSLLAIELPADGRYRLELINMSVTGPDDGASRYTLAYRRRRTRGDHR